MAVILAQGNDFIIVMYYSNITHKHCLGVKKMVSKTQFDWAETLAQWDPGQVI